MDILCKECGEKVTQTTGKRKKEFCNSTCRSNFWQKAERKARTERSKTNVSNLNEPTGKKEIKPPSTTDTTIDTTRKPFMSDAIKKKLGIK